MDSLAFGQSALSRGGGVRRLHREAFIHSLAQDLDLGFHRELQARAEVLPPVLFRSFFLQPCRPVINIYELTLASPVIQPVFVVLNERRGSTDTDPYKPKTYLKSPR